jgi:hypothetical protein
MEKENKNNRLIKGLWSLTGLKSSDYIRIAKQIHPDLTGSRLRGLMSGMANSNYRPATNRDVLQCLIVVTHWIGDESFPVQDVSDSTIEALLYEVDRLIAHSDSDGLTEKDRVKKALKKINWI